ncbi:MAG: FAD-dependent monooxygenase [Rhodobacteraceae bacterium]|nr:FAD-dependent monooxygenase [Paracoccaceae bacterium]
MSAIGLSVDVIGAGVAGLAVATALAQRGASVTVHEQAPEIAEVGAGLQISPNGAAVLAALGQGDALRAAGLDSRAVVLRDYAQGRQVLRLDLTRLPGPHPFILIHRARLIEILERAARGAGVTIKLGSRVKAGDLDAGLVIGADGVRSGIRAALNGSGKPFFTGQVAWRAVIADEGVSPEAHVWMGPRRHLVTYPLSGGLRNIVAVEERSAWADEGWNHEDDPANLQRAFAGFAPEVRGWLDRVETVHLWGLFRHPVAARWHDNGRVILGDAAHPTLPFLAQGANLALEDAWVLADCLAQLPQAEALALYQSRRAPRARRVIEAANANARNYHLANPLVRNVAHTVLRVGGAVAPQAALGRFEWLYGHDVTKGG